MEWKGKEVKTIGDVIYALEDLQSKEEASSFMQLYCAHEPVNARQNVGYLTGYFSTEKADRLMDWCETSHPIFGRTHPPPEKLFEMGRIMGERAKAKSVPSPTIDQWVSDNAKDLEDQIGCHLEAYDGYRDDEELLRMIMTSIRQWSEDGR